MADTYAASVFSSGEREEGFGISLLEASAAGGVAGNRIEWWIPDDGRIGLRVPISPANIACPVGAAQNRMLDPPDVAGGGLAI